VRKERANGLVRALKRVFPTEDPRVKFPEDEGVFSPQEYELLIDVGLHGQAKSPDEILRWVRWCEIARISEWMLTFVLEGKIRPTGSWERGEPTFVATKGDKS